MTDVSDKMVTKILIAVKKSNKENVNNRITKSLFHIHIEIEWKIFF